MVVAWQGFHRVASESPPRPKFTVAHLRKPLNETLCFPRRIVIKEDGFADSNCGLGIPTVLRLETSSVW